MLRSTAARLRCASARRLSTLTPGSTLSGFKVQSTTPIPELEINAVQLKHVKTGSEYLHLHRDDSNNVFAVGFRTAVDDSTGVPHILEHTTLCGSKKYPVRDPFFKMLNRSISTYMNAWTAADYTLYPFSTENNADFFNLMDVYLDATFQPKLNKLDFNQEGWRLEHESPTDLSSPVSFKGVVYNEMKGVMSDVGSQFSEKLQHHVHKGSTYEHNSGGNPENITDLTYQQLVDFHRLHYHPSNAKFFSYGNFPLEKTLAFIDQRIAQFQALGSVPIAHDKTPRRAAPETVQASCAPDPAGGPQRQAKVAISFLANDVSSTYESFCMKILSYLLLDGPSSPMRKALIESGLGVEYSPVIGYDGSKREATITFGVQGARPEDVDKVTDTVWDVLRAAKQEGFDQGRIDAALHQIELSLKHKTANFGLGLLQFVSSGWFQGAKPIDLLSINRDIERFRSESSTALLQLLDKHILNNPHCVTLVMEPQEDYQERVAQEEAERLATMTRSLTQEQHLQIAKEATALTEARAQVEDVSCLPTLTLKDIGREARHRVTSTHTISTVPVQWRTTGTNAISYLRGINYLDTLPQGLLLYLPLFCSSLTHQGTRDTSMAELHDEIQLFTGGVGAGSLITTNHSDLTQTRLGLSFSGNAMDRNIGKMYSLLSTLLAHTNFDNTERLRVLIDNTASAFTNSLAYEGHVFARSLASSHISRFHHVHEQWGGTAQLRLMSQLSQTQDLSSVVESLKSISTRLNASDLKLSVVCEPNIVSRHEAQIGSLVQSYPHSSASTPSDTSMLQDFTPQHKKVFVPTPFTVNFASTAIAGVPYTHGDSIKLQVLAKLLSTHFLHKAIREENGAYGGGAAYDAINGVFSFYSYRDPQSVKTVDTFARSLKWLCDGERKISDRELMEAKLSIFGSMDSPEDVADEGSTLFRFGITREMRQRRRDQLFDVTYEQLLDAAKRHLLDQPSASAIIGDQTLLPELAKDEWTVMPLQ
ncbi:Mitochondrial presequence protease [Sorochytrium milnesiophthora]